MTALPHLQSHAGTTPVEFVVGVALALPLVALSLWFAWMGRRRP